MDLAFSTIKELRELLDAKKISAVELAKEFLARIKKHDKDLNAFITVTEEEALAQARQADRAIAKGEAGIFTGIPFAAKDLFSVRGIKTTAASKRSEEH